VPICGLFIVAFCIEHLLQQRAKTAGAESI
jgi:hypothetical protein